MSMPTVLFLGANARDTTRLRLGAEVRDIRIELDSAGIGEVLRVVPELAVRPSDLQRLLLLHAPDVIHFSGHGTGPRAGGTAARVEPADAPREFLSSTEDGAPAIDDDAIGGLLLENERGAAVAVRPEVLSALLAVASRDVPLRCVVLNACFTASQAQAIAEHIDCVIGASREIGDEAAIAFSTAFYRAIAHGKSVGTAFELGRIEIGLRGLPGEDVLRLFCRPGIAPDGVLLSDSAYLRNFRDEPLRTSRPPLSGPPLSTPPTSRPRRSTPPLPEPRIWPPHWAHVLEPAKHFLGRDRLRAELGAWLAKDGDPTRVVSICAIGGTGKTALAEVVLTDWLDDLEKAGEPLPSGVFVWSFYENDRVDDFLGEACGYFVGDEGELGGRSARLAAALKDGRPHLLVLDGLETVQAEGGADGVKGELRDAGFRALVRQIAARQLGHARLLVTSRFSLCDISSFEENGAWKIELEDLDKSAARAALRAWGVRGDDATLDALADKVGRHALSVRVMGAFLKSYAGGDGAEGLELDLDVITKEASDADQKAAKLGTLLGHLSQKMPAPERELMARLSLFHRGISVELLETLADAGEKIAGVLAHADEERLQLLLRRLVAQGLAFAYGEGPHVVYTAHPFLRDHFKKLVGVKAEDVHEVLRQRLAPSLESRPRKPPRDAETLDRYEALIEHTRLAGKVEEAFELYWYGMWSAENLARYLGEYRRGKRILDGFSPDGSPERCALDLRARDRSLLIDDWGKYARHLGDLAFAKRCFEEAVIMARREPQAGIVSHALRSLARVELDRGNPLATGRYAAEALYWAKAGRRDSKGMTVCCAYLGFAAFLTGKIASAREHFAEATHLEAKPLSSYIGLLESEFRLRLGDRNGALGQSEQNLVVCEREGWKHVTARLHTLLGHLVLPDAPAESRRWLARSRAYAAQTGDLEVTLRAHLLAATIERQEGKPDLAHAEASEGLLLADTHGFGLYAVDLLLVLARAALARNAPAEALGHAKRALERSTDPECGFAWGEADALHLMGLAYRDRGERDAAREQFERAAEIRARIEHPEVSDSRAQADDLQ